MAAGSPVGDEHMEELVDHGLGMEETDQSLLRRPSLRETYHSDSLLNPDADFITGRKESVTKVQAFANISGLFVTSGESISTQQKSLLLLVLIDDGKEPFILSGVYLNEHHKSHLISDGSPRTSHNASRNDFKCLES